MARITLAQANTRIAELEAANAALEARLEIARKCWKAHRQQIADLEAQLAARGAAKVIPAPPARPVKTLAERPTCRVRVFRRADGSLWERRATGSTTSVVRPFAFC